MDIEHFNSYPKEKRLQMVQEEGEFMPNPIWGELDMRIAFWVRGFPVIVHVDLETLEFISVTAYTVDDEPVFTWVGHIYI